MSGKDHHPEGMGYRPKGAKPHFDAASYSQDMARLGGNWSFAGMVTMFRQPHTHEIDGADIGGPTQLALTTVAFWETELLAAARGRAR